MAFESVCVEVNAKKANRTTHLRNLYTTEVLRLKSEMHLKQ